MHSYLDSIAASNRSSSLGRARGFTLLEILIAMAIFTLIGIASTGVLTSVIDSDKLSNERFGKLQTLQRAMLTLERDVLQAVERPVRVEGEASERVMYGGDGVLESDHDGLAFVHGGWYNPQLRLPRSTLQGVGYRVQERQLQRLYGNYVDNVIGYEPKVKVLLENIDDFKVYFISAQEDEEGDSAWQEDYSDTVLPKAVAIEFTSQDFGFIRREFLLSGSSS
ncbi:type II secretion system minor pseudopilin GspJ [uncultured Paraglaciecola sp.]|uniref:type II secretion system minor pseudopilin GspJ n=1 Tax=uncultured Paraglaciecola sp. TaxID=1765024 RepID=UPI0030DA9EB9|tara:strand:- start:16592 stop:17260 length:669 start_codon:yes stop_codon:yes gene_type:complete